MRFHFAYLNVLFCSLMGVSFTSYGAAIDVTLDQDTITLSDEGLLTLKVEGAGSASPVSPKVDGLVFENLGQSSQIQIINGRSSRSTEYRFRILPERSGSFVIPSMRLKVNGKNVSSQALKLTVLPAGKSSPDGNENEVRLETTVSHDKAYVGEVIIVKYNLLSRQPIIGLSMELGEAKDFQVFEVKDKKQSRQLVDGIAYHSVSASFLFMAKRAGKKTLPMLQAVVEIQAPKKRQPRRTQRGRSVFEDFFSQDMFGRRRGIRKRLRSESKLVPIKALPKPIPKNFSGLVGQFALTASLDAKRIKVGDTATLTLHLDGQGDLEGIEAPTLRTPRKIRVYDSKPAIEQTMLADEGIVGQALFEYALVPEVAGSYTIPSPSVSVFSPDLGQFVQLKAEKSFLEVTGGAVDEKAFAANNEDTPQGLEEALQSEPKDVPVAQIKSSTELPYPLPYSVSYLNNHSAESKVRIMSYILIVLHGVLAFLFLPLGRVREFFALKRSKNAASLTWLVKQVDDASNIEDIQKSLGQFYNAAGISDLGAYFRNQNNHESSVEWGRVNDLLEQGMYGGKKIESFDFKNLKQSLIHLIQGA